MADTTALAESAQAIFCSIADNLGVNKSPMVLDIKKYPTFSDFETNNKQLIASSLKRVKVDVKIQEVYDFLVSNLGWYKSSVIIANSLVRDLKSIDKDFKIAQAGYSDGKMFYLRGDAEVMNLMAKLFKAANSSLITQLLKKDIPKIIGFTDINKWSPADIYLANPTAKTRLQKELRESAKLYTFDDLNSAVTELIDSGSLLPLSLKKTTSTAKLYKVNFDENEKAKLLRKIKFMGTSDWRPYKRLAKTERGSWSAFKKGGKTATRDLRLNINLGNGQKGEIKLRHDPSGTSGRFVIEFIGGGAEARGGSIGSTRLFHRIWSTIDKTAANDFLNAYNKGNEKFVAIKKSYNADKAFLREDKIGKVSEYDHYMAIASAENIINKIMPGLKKWFRSNEGKNSQKLVRLMFQYVTSRDPLSAKFVIAK